MNLRSPLLRIYWLIIKWLQVWGILPLSWPIPKYKPTLELLLQYPIRLNLVADFFPLLHKSPIYDQLLCTDPSTWLTPQKPFDFCSWFATASHRITNKIFNVGTREFVGLQNLKAYKIRSKNSFFCRRLGFQKENLIKLSKVRFFFFHLL